MAEQQQSVALVRRAESLPAQVLSDDEMRRMYRLAESMHLSGAYDDIKQAEQAFVKMMLGRDLGLSPTQAMGGLHLVKGNVSVHYAMLARFINARQDDGYAYRPGWIYQDDVPEGEPAQKYRDAVYLDEDDPLDMREVVGCFIVFSIQGQQIGVSRYTLEDAETAGLIKSGLDPRAAWATSRRNMFLARAMSNGVKWLVPEVMGGLPIYVQGEIEEAKPSVTAPVGEGDDQGTGIDLGPKIDAVIERATELGHRGLMNRARLELQLGKRSPGVVAQFAKDAKEELDRFEAEKAKAEEEEPPDADVVTEDDVAEEQTKLDPEVAAAAAGMTEEALLRARRDALIEARGEEQDPEQKSLIDEEIDMLEETLQSTTEDKE